jgi:uncharacterized protein (TIGR00725 family)
LVIIAVCGASSCDQDTYRLAEDVGREIARRGAALVCGGLGGVMEAAAKGAKEGGALTIGILPGFRRGDANPYIQVPVVTGMHEGRNLVIVRTADAVIALPGSYGTLSEIALALKIEKPVVGINTWNVVAGMVQADDARDAVEKALAALGQGEDRS